MYYEEEQRSKLGITEFSTIFYDRLSRVITNSAHIEEFQNFYEHYCFKAYELYNNSKTDNYSLNIVISLFEIMLDSLFKYQPDNFLSDDTINIS